MAIIATYFRNNKLSNFFAFLSHSKYRFFPTQHFFAKILVRWTFLFSIFSFYAKVQQYRSRHSESITALCFPKTWKFAYYANWALLLMYNFYSPYMDFIRTTNVNVCNMGEAILFKSSCEIISEIMVFINLWLFRTYFIWNPYSYNEEFECIFQFLCANKE